MEVLIPNWPAPTTIRAFTTTRIGGHSQGSYAHLNLGLHAGDDPQAVNANRALVQDHYNLPSPPTWLKQTHSNEVIAAEQVNSECSADASTTSTKNTVCAILTADCLPILLTNQAGSEVAAIHAGWRGLAKNIIKNTVQTMQTASEKILAWLGPAIGPSAFEVGAEVKSQFLQLDAMYTEAFRPLSVDKCLANIFTIARLQLQQCGVTRIYTEQLCTYTDVDRFFSYRRDKITGRMASLIWIQS
ncbi:MAG: peptidoglycan editing factor PgeF [Gammaproteobacteria bacterium]